MNEKEFKEMIGKGKPSYNVIYIGGTNYPNEKYNSFWALLNAEDKFYYVEYNKDHFLYDMNDLTITLYNKVSPYEKRQADYSKNVKNLNDILNYISTTKNKKFKNLKDTHNQKIFYQLDGYTEKKDGKPYTILKRLRDISGYREKYVLDNLNRIEEYQKNENYYILKFIDNEENYFLVNLKDVNRLIVG